jgi:hypothetical protein
MVGLLSFFSMKNHLRRMPDACDTDFGAQLVFDDVICLPGMT